MERSSLYIDLLVAIDKWAKKEGAHFPEAFRDALTDLRHMADYYTVPFEKTLKSAKEVYLEELDAWKEE